MKAWKGFLMCGLQLLGVGCSLAEEGAAPWPVTVTNAWSVTLPGMAGFTASADGRRLLVNVQPLGEPYAVVALNERGKELWRRAATTGKIYTGGITTDGTRGASTAYQVDEKQQQVCTDVAVFSMADGKVLATHTYTAPWHGEMDGFFVPMASISPNGKFLLCVDPLSRFIEVYEILLDRLQLRWSAKDVTPPLPNNEEWDTITWLSDSSGIVLGTEQGTYYQITHEGKRGWSLPPLADTEGALPGGGATVSTAPTGNILSVWGSTRPQAWKGNPSNVQPDFGQIEGVETAQIQVGFHLVKNDPPVITTLRALGWLGSDWGSLARVSAVKHDRELLAVLLFDRQPIFACLPISLAGAPATAVSTFTPMSNLQGGGSVSVAWALGHSLLATVSPIPVAPRTTHTQLAFYNYAGKQLWSTTLPEEPASTDAALYFAPYGRTVYVGTIAREGGTITKFTLDK